LKSELLKLKEYDGCWVVIKEAMAKAAFANFAKCVVVDDILTGYIQGITPT
jgi:hypothetical protein